MAEIEQQLRGSAHTTAMAALEVVPFAMLIVDGSAQALAANGKWTDLTGLDRIQSAGPGWLGVLEPDARARLRDDVLKVARNGGTSTVDHQRGAGSRRRWTRWWISRHDFEGRALVAVAAADVEDDYARQANLYHLATHDSLTGLINRSHFIECIDQALRRSQRQSKRVAVVYVDLDGFKTVNDRGGHSLGDRVLFAIASRLRHAVRSADVVARIGGDEFAVLCEGLTASEQADVVARRIAMALAESVELDGERWSVAASVGAAVDHGDPETAEGLVDRADRAMYSVKQERQASDGEPQAVPDPSREPERRAGPDGAVAYHTPAARPDVAAAGARRVAQGGSRGAETLSDDEVSILREAAARRATDVAFAAERDAAGGVGEVAGVGGAAGVSGATSPGPSRLGVLEPDEARRALRDLAEAAASYAEASSATTEGPAAGAEPARHRLAADVISLRESIDSIRRMLDRLLAADAGVIDIRDNPPR